VAAVAALGVWAAPWLARAGPAERLTSGLAVVFALLIVPGIVALLSDVAGLTETLRRTLWIVPFPALVGLLAAVSVTGRIGRLVPAAVAVSVAALLVAFGTPLWRHLYEDRSLWHYPPGWKAHRIPEARVILRKYQGDGPILAERGVMLAIALVTAEPKAVNARTLYLERTRLPAEQIEDRILLTNFISRENPLPSAAQVRRALTDIHVGLVCARDDGTGAVPAIRRLGTLQEVFRAHGELCFQPRTASSE
jgi:hypothetical protein